jgi:hypothetical protein
MAYEATLPSTDPVQQIGFSFYNDRLFRIVVDYDRDRTEGMTDADMVEAISAVYGVPALEPPDQPASPTRVETESGSPVARWETQPTSWCSIEPRHGVASA